jgi:antibiotic biosynthesis monooxygenase (ABM) superfamily enzyme
MSNHTAQQAAPAAPPRYKLALISWAGAYGVITLILGLLGPTIAVWPLVLRTLLISVLMTTALTWVVLPALTRLFRVWLLASTSAQAQGALTPAVVVDDTTGDRPAPRPVPSTCAPGSRGWAPAGRAS